MEAITMIDTVSFLPTRIKRITSHVGISRYLDTLRDTNHETKRFAAIPSPYAFSATHRVYRDPEGLLVFVVETAHKRYDVFSLPAGAELQPEAL
jgi:hypothetical protein